MSNDFLVFLAACGWVGHVFFWWLHRDILRRVEIFLRDESVPLSVKEKFFSNKDPR